MEKTAQDHKEMEAQIQTLTTNLETTEALAQKARVETSHFLQTMRDSMDDFLKVQQSSNCPTFFQASYFSRRLKDMGGSIAKIILDQR